MCKILGRAISALLVIALIMLAGCAGDSLPQPPVSITNASATSNTSVELTFDEVVENADNANSYSISSETGANLAVVAAYVEADGKTVTIATNPQEEVSYTLSLASLSTQAQSNSVPVQTSFVGTGQLAPIVASAISLSNTEVLITFIDPKSALPAEMGPSAEDKRFYEISAPDLDVLDAKLSNDKTTVTLTTSEQKNIEYLVKVTNVKTAGPGNQKMLIDPFHNTASLNGIPFDDQKPPEVLEAFAVDDITVVLRFSEPLSEDAVNAINYSITDSEGNTLPVIHAVLNEFSTQITLTTLPQASFTYTIVLGDDVKDRSGNKVDPNTTSFEGKSSEDPPFVASAIALNNPDPTLGDVLVVFSQDMEQTAAENIAYYSIANPDLEIQSAKLKDGNTVVLTTPSHQDVEYTLKVNNLRSKNGNKLLDPERSTATFNGLPEEDIDPPQLKSLAVITNTTLLVSFSEAVEAAAGDASKYTITDENGKVLAVTSAALNAFKTQVTLTTVPQIDGIEYTLVVSDVADLAGNDIDPTNNSATFIGLATTPPEVLSAIAQSNTSVLVTFNQKLEQATAENVNFYSLTPSLAITAAALQADESSVMLTTDSQDDIEYEVKVTNLKSKSSSQLINPDRSTATFNSIPEADTTPPTVTDAFPNNSTTVVVLFSEAVSEEAVNPTSYSITGSDGKEVLITEGSINEQGNKVTLSTTLLIEGVTYTVLVTGVEDSEGNVIVNDGVGNKATFTGPPSDDKEPPKVANAGATNNTTVVVTFNEPVQKENAENPAHYSIFRDSLATQSVLVIKEAVLSEDGLTITLTTGSQAEILYTVEVTNVKDLAGNQISPKDRLTGATNVATFIGRPPTGKAVDSDGDGLSDSEEQRGWIVTVQLADGTTAKREVTSDINSKDTDEDGIADRDEKTYLTDPRNADTDEDQLTDYQELNQIYSNPAVQDTDEDGLADGLEFNFFKTSPTLADTDGDQFSDADEIDQSFRNPRLADLPLHTIDVGEVEVELNVEIDYITTEGTQKTEQNDQSVTLERSNSQESSTSDTTTLEWFAKASLETEVGASFPSSFAAEATFKAEAGVGASGTFEMNNTSKQAAQNAYNQSQNVSNQSGVSETLERRVAGGKLVLPLIIQNAGDIAFTLSDVEVTALYPNPRNPTSFIPIGTLLSSTSTTYNLGTIDAKRGPFKFETQADEVNPDLIDELLRNPQGILLEVSNFDITDEFDNNFSFQQQDVTERTAPIVIDFGDGRVERYWVAVSTGREIGGDRIVFDENGKVVGITLREALEDVIDLDFSDDSGIINRIDDRSTDATKNQAWVLLTENGYDPDVSIDKVILTRGNGVTFAFISDEDNDGLPKRLEDVYGTSDLKSDTDGDGLGDKEEITTGYEVNVVGELSLMVFSSPISADADGDGLNDKEERNLGTNANSADTDGDGACDSDLVQGCLKDDDPLDPTKGALPPLLAQYNFDETVASGNTATDSSGNDNPNDGTYRDDGSNCVKSVENRLGTIEHAVRFNVPSDGGDCTNDSSGYVQIPHIEGISESFSIGLWVRPNNYNNGLIVGQLESDGSGNVVGGSPWFRLFLGTDNVDPDIVDGEGEGNKISFYIPHDSEPLLLTDPEAVTEDTWASYVVTVSADDGKTTAILYKDGVSVASTTTNVTYPNPSTSDEIFISNPNVNFERYKGDVDDLSIYGGAIIPSQVQELYTP